VAKCISIFNILLATASAAKKDICQISVYF
jgi:hypothetical protein